MESVQPARERFSLLWPSGKEETDTLQFSGNQEHWVQDLSFESLAKALSYSSRYPIRIEQLIRLLTDHEEALTYRQDILQDLLDNPSLEECLTEVLPKIDELAGLNYTKINDVTPLQQTAWRLGELELYTECVNRLKNALDSVEGTIRSQGFKVFHRCLTQVAGEESFRSVTLQLPQMREGISRFASVSLGINLDAHLRPYAVTILSINDQPFSGRSSILGRLLPKPDPHAYTGITPLIQIKNIAKLGEPPQYDPFQLTLFQQIHDAIGSVARPIAATLAHYTGMKSGFLVDLKEEIIFLLGAIHLLRRIRETGMPLCKARVLPKEERAFKVENIYNINLALGLHSANPGMDLPHEIVTNRVEFGKDGRIFILTGPNRGGKTTYLQAIGLTQILFQLGLLVPGTEACISPADGIFTHFPVEEKPDSNLGRLGEESRRLNDIFRQATRYSLVLLNESLCSTSFSEGLYISREVVSGFKLLGVRMIFTTHFHELARNLDKFNKTVPGDSRVVSLVSGVFAGEGAADAADAGDPVRRTYVIQPGPPQGLSYARDIASRYGISLKNIILTLQSREVIKEEAEAGCCEEMYLDENEA